MITFETDRRSRAEQLLLSSLLKNNDCVRRIDPMRIMPCEFSHDLHGQIYRHIAKLIAMSEPVDVGSVFVSMTRHRKTNPVGLFAYLNALVSLPSVPANAGYYACSMRC
ncbi:DnaB-like helicase N-terminal domain-containing protein [Paraburkholderia sp. RL18-103-BIB-C]|uniref:DnaB-like helicase N-terminal domain-containing protein n=1 Tax=Paraburkholderia sp. RL18-103-BIB-C TaxID=3031637 RepID=UPI0038B7BE0E